MQSPRFDDATEIIEGADFEFVVQEFDTLWPKTGEGGDLA
jgi:hypothetical protein